jgi:hypothetical protein
MSEKIFKVGEPITVVYQAVASSTTATLTVYKNDYTPDTAKSGSMAMVTTSIFIKDFTPDAAREWIVQIVDNKGGKVINRYSVGTYNLQTVGSNIDILTANIATVQTSIDGLSNPPMVV